MGTPLPVSASRARGCGHRAARAVRPRSDHTRAPQTLPRIAYNSGPQWTRSSRGRSTTTTAAARRPGRFARSSRRASFDGCARPSSPSAGACCARSPGPTSSRPPVYERDPRRLPRASSGAIEKVEARLGDELWDRVDLLPEERELVRDRPRLSALLAHRRASTRSSPPSRYQFVELNAETPGGHRLRRGPGRHLPRAAHREEVPGALYAAALPGPRARCSRRSSPATARRGARTRTPTIAIVDYEEVPTRTEHHLFREFFEAQGCPSLVCDPRHLTLRGRPAAPRRPRDRHRLQAAARERVPGAHRPAASRCSQAAKDRAVVDREPVPLQAHPQEGHLRGADRRRAAAALHATRSARPSPPTCPGRAACARGETTRDGADDRPARLRPRQPRAAW